MKIVQFSYDPRKGSRAAALLEATGIDAPWVESIVLRQTGEPSVEFKSKKGQVSLTLLGRLPEMERVEAHIQA